MTMALCCLADQNCSGKRTIYAHECGPGEPCASRPAKTPKLGPCESTSDEDEEDKELVEELVVEEDDDNEEDEAAAALDTTDADPMTKGSKICSIDLCGKWSTWGPIGGPRCSSRFCAPHGKAHGGCENVRNKRCKEPGCKSVSPNFGPVGGIRKDATFCSAHGKPKGYVDIVNSRCEECGKYAIFGLPGGKRIRCGDHRDDYIDLVNKLCQHVDGCRLYPSYGVKGGRPEFCGNHSNKEMHEDVVTPRCVTCVLTPKKFRHSHSKTRQCNECDPTIHNMPRKKKEEAVKAVLEAAFAEHFLTRELHVNFCGQGADRTACGKNPSKSARLDFVLETVLADGDGAVVQVEVDEDAHRHYCPADEIIRAQSIVAALHEAHHHRHVHVVRFNPDAFKIGDKTKYVSLKKRYAKLVEVVNAALASNKEKNTWSLQYMYYDCDTGGEDRRLRIMDEIHPHIQLIVREPIIN